MPPRLIVSLAVLVGLGGCYNPGLDALKTAEKACAEGNIWECNVGVTYKEAMVKAGTPDALPPDYGALGLLGLTAQALLGVGGYPTTPRGYHWHHHGYHPFYLRY